MENLNLEALVRSKTEKLSDIRNNRMVPWIVYWNKEKQISLKINYSDFLKIYRLSWWSRLINLNVWKKNIEVLVHQIQKQPLTWDYLHIDFFAITRWQELTTKISLNFIWESNAVKEWGILNESLKEVEVKCLPKNLVENFDVDLSVLKNIWDSIRISDLKIDTEKFTLLNNTYDIIVAANSPAKIEVEQPIVDVPVTWADEPTEEKTDDKK